MKIYDKNDKTLTFKSMLELWNYVDNSPNYNDCSDDEWEDYIRAYELLKDDVLYSLRTEDYEKALERINDIQRLEKSNHYFVMESEGES